MAANRGVLAKGVLPFGSTSDQHSGGTGQDEEGEGVAINGKDKQEGGGGRLKEKGQTERGRKRR